MTVQWQESRSLHEDLERGSLFFPSSICLCGKEGTDPQTVCWRFCLLQAGFAGCAEDFWPRLCLQGCWRGRRGRLCCCFIHSACRRVASPPSGPAQDSHPSPNMKACTASQVQYSILSPAWHPKSNTASQDQCIWQIKPGASELQRNTAGRGPLVQQMGSFPSWGQGVSAEYRNIRDIRCTWERAGRANSQGLNSLSQSQLPLVLENTHQSQGKFTGLVNRAAARSILQMRPTSLHP